MIINRITQPPKHHLFGFHDICAWNSNNDRLVALEVENIRTPPDPVLEYGLGYVNEENRFTLFGSTHAFNYPQGARQQWIADTNNVIVNDIRDRKVISKIYDTDNRILIDTLSNSTHTVTNDGWAFGINYARLFRLGAYGYNGVIDTTEGENTPVNDGIIKHNIYTKEYQLLISIQEIVNYRMNPKQGKHHYITHLVLSPNQQRIAFLHRFKLSDGGETTRLCTIGINGEKLHCLGTGFLSHFDWQDDNHIMIWGRTGSNIEKLRNSFLYQLLPTKSLRFAKSVVKNIIHKQKDVTYNSMFHWITFTDIEDTPVSYIAEGMITEDGHPMFCPVNRNWFICDNYPNNKGIRTLFLFNIQENRRINLGEFKMSDMKPDLTESKRLLNDTEPSVLKVIGLENLAFVRSGLHCDLHPRWSPNGKKIAFDSIHEGTRQIYMVNFDPNQD
ncbi:MAG: hypothetical protein LBE13_15215 [Bacteroidales bacterium]|jgi:hypothetical protein|nr:hypothetical protein [Bacteroidales bacterium]